MKKCSKCQTFLPYENFSRGTNFGYASYCKKCANKYYKSRYQRKTKIIKVTETHKQCRICEQMKPNSEYSSKNGGRPKESYCKECKKFMGTERVLKKYRLNVDSYMDIFNAQNGVCKICKNPEKDGKRLAVDHDHSCCAGASSCGKCIRGLLCSRCNKALGIVEDNADILNSMIEYLK